MDLDPRNSNQLLVVSGGYEQYLEAKELELAASARHETVKRNTLRRETEWLRRGSIARQTKQQARIDAAHNLKEEVAQLESRNRHRQVKIEFGEAENAPQKLIEAKSISMQFGEKMLFSQLNVLLRRQSRLAILGDNGIGKSTLIKVLLGEVSPTTGTVQRAEDLQVAYFEQNRETLNPNLSVLKNICPNGDYLSYRGQHIHVRSYLDRFLFFGHQAELPVHRLSGGEQARLRLAQVMLSDAQVLVLDEPTNDLDADTLDVLENSLSEFPGALILVTHDRYFMDALADEILAFPPSDYPHRELVRFADYWQWEKWFRSLKTETRAKGSDDSVPASSASGARRIKLSFKEQFELDHIEEEILKLEQRQQELQAESQLPDVVTNRERLQKLMTELSNVSMHIEGKYERWELLSAKAAGKS
jgi:ATP-binding cassette subfamily F protein uup